MSENRNINIPAKWRLTMDGREVRAAAMPLWYE